MKTLLVTTPIRDAADNFPPIGVLALMKAVRDQGISEAVFYHIDGNRPSYQEVLDRIQQEKPEILGISAVVSTAYDYMKRLSLDIKRLLPETLIVLGGNMAACGELALRRTGVDLCVLGEGETVLCNIIERAQSTTRPVGYGDIPGLLFLGEDGQPVNTGYEKPLPAHQLYPIDWEELAQVSDMRRYVCDETSSPHGFSKFQHDPRFQAPHRRGKKLVTMVGSKGCVARCTFCHRWQKGIRYIPPELLMQRLEALIERYDVGFVVWNDENFGTDKRWLKAFCQGIRKYDLLWTVSGMRTNCIDPASIQLMKEAGCTTIVYGMESGSDAVLQMMEKKITVAQNRQAMAWTLEADLDTTVQLVIGMPGESPETVAETSAFVQYCQSLRPEHDPSRISITYAQALPGTPLYEFARQKGLIEPGFDGEEKYLLEISDADAADVTRTINFTDYPDLELHAWRRRIQIAANYHFVKKFGMAQYKKAVKQKTLLSAHPLLFHYLEFMLIPMGWAIATRKRGLKYGAWLMWDYLRFKITGRVGRGALLEGQPRSLRKILRHELGDLPSDHEAMIPLRRGR
ncbi:MAG: radical SAM protein [Magnetococcales bacterium]|nr:radical SAM protein [Magnetococcales bacterium]